MSDKIAEKIHILPVLPLRGLPVFPDMIIHFDVGREKSIAAVDKSIVENQLIFLLPQKDMDVEQPTSDDLCTIGTIAKVKQMIKLSENNTRVLVEGISRGTVENFVKTSPYFECTVRESVPKPFESEEKIVTADAYMAKLKSLTTEYFSLFSNIPKDTFATVIEDADPEHFSDVLSAVIPFSSEEKMSLLLEADVLSRLEMLVELITKEIQNKQISEELEAGVKRRIDKNQREFYLREKLKYIQDELGDGESVSIEIDDYLTKLEQKCVPKPVYDKAKKELSKLRKMQMGNPEGSVIRDYVGWLVDMPWTEKSEENTDLALCEKILEEDHYGLKEVKERIVEFLAVRKLSGGKKSPILCLVGPPGVGKTSVAKSIARSLGREYVRLSLGGVKDESEIRGHRKTYVGAMPGRIATALKQAGTINPLILLDEIDKLSSDFRGNPSAALLEVLDSAQNFSFRDHYLELECDLSDVLFITTANTLDTIDRPLLDRMEIIELSGYTDGEKEQIAINYIIPNQLKSHGMTKSMVKFAPGVIFKIINDYTRESGVRELERKIEKIFRKAAKTIMIDGKKSVSVSNKSLETYLGKPIFSNTKKNPSEIGVATGLAWTQYGGDVLYVEAEVMSGSGNVELTGQLGDVMKESAKAAITFIRSNADKYGIDKDFYKKNDIHIHVPEGAVPKDGPSAGITLTTALISALSGKKINNNVAMTGEITITGKILPIGGLKEKSLAAHRMGIDKILIPVDNKKDISDIPDEVKGALEFIPADNINTVLKHALM